MISQTIVGLSYGCLYCSEQMLVLKYSKKEDREKNNSFIKATNGLGAVFLPCLVSTAVAVVDWWLAFIIVSIMLAIVTPISHYKLTQARDFLQVRSSN